MEERQRKVDVPILKSFAGTPVRMRLANGSERVGLMRTELLSERSISVYLGHGEADGEGETVYIDDIIGIWPRD